MPTVNPIPEDYPRVTPHLSIAGAAGAIDFHTSVLGASERMRMAMPDGTVAHAEISPHVAYGRGRARPASLVWATPDSARPGAALGRSVKPVERQGCETSRPASSSSSPRPRAPSTTSPGPFVAEQSCGFVERMSASKFSSQPTRRSRPTLR